MMMPSPDAGYLDILVIGEGRSARLGETRGRSIIRVKESRFCCAGSTTVATRGARSSSTNARVSSHVGSRPAARTCSSVGASRSRSDRIGSPSMAGQLMSSAGSQRVDGVLACRVVARRAQVHHRRIVFQRKESVAETLGDVDRPSVRGRRAPPHPTARKSVSRPGCRRRRRTPRRAGTSRTWPGSAAAARSAGRAAPRPPTPSSWPDADRTGARRTSVNAASVNHSKNTPRGVGVQLRA